MNVSSADARAVQAEIENYVIDSISWDKDLFVKTFEVKQVSLLL